MHKIINMPPKQLSENSYAKSLFLSSKNHTGPFASLNRAYANKPTGKQTAHQSAHVNLSIKFIYLAKLKKFHVI